MALRQIREQEDEILRKKSREVNIDDITASKNPNSTNYITSHFKVLVSSLVVTSGSYEGDLKVRCIKRQ